jgi:hypothetical protein
MKWMFVFMTLCFILFLQIVLQKETSAHADVVAVTSHQEFSPNLQVTATFTPVVTNTPTPEPTPCGWDNIPPQLIAPAHRSHTTNTTPNFRWEFNFSDHSYKLFIYNVERSFAFRKRIFDNDHYRITTPLAPQKYYWRVKKEYLHPSCSYAWSKWSNPFVLFID